MTGLDKPVLPLVLQLGSTVDDGEGAVALHREMATEPDRFFPSTYRDVMNKVGLLALDRGINDAETVAQVSAEMLARELEAVPQAEQSTSVKRRLAAARQFVKSLPIVASAIKILEWVKGLLPFI